MNILSFEKFNEGLGDFIRKKFNKDAMGIYDKIEDNIHITEDDDVNFGSVYRFSIDNFDITSMETIGFRDREYKVFVDDNKLDCSNSIARKIHRKIDSVFRMEDEENSKRKKEEENFARKDAKIHFSRR